MDSHLLALASDLQLPLPLARKMAMLALDRPANAADPLTPCEELSLVVGSWLLSICGFAADPVVLLLKELQPWFRKIAPEIQQAWLGEEQDPVPGYELHIADGRYVVWGDHEQFWDLKDLRYLNPLPMPPAWRTSVHLAGLYFRYQTRRLRSKDGESSTNTQVAAG